MRKDEEEQRIEQHRQITHKHTERRGVYANEEQNQPHTLTLTLLEAFSIGLLKCAQVN